MLNPKRFLFNVLLATSCLTTAGYAATHQLDIDIDESVDHVKVAATLDRQSFLHRFSREGGSQSPSLDSTIINVKMDAGVITYEINELSLFRINLQRSSIDILANIQDLYLALKTNMSVTLSENEQQTRLAGASVVSTADVFNRGELFIGEKGFQGSSSKFNNEHAGIICVGSPFEFEALSNGELSNECGTIKASTINITATAIHNTQGVLSASKNTAPEKSQSKVYPLCVETEGVSLVAKRLIDNRSGLISDSWSPYILPTNPLPSKRRTGFDNRSGVILGGRVQFNHNGWPFLFHNATVHSDSDVNADVAELTREDESFVITARGSIQLRSHEFKGHPKLTAHNIEFNIPFHKDVPVLTFGKNTKVETRIFKLTTLDEFYPKVSLSGNLTADIFEVGVDAFGDMHCKVACIDLRSPKGALALRSNRNEVSKVRAKASDLEALKDFQNIDHIYVYVKPNTDVLQFKSLHLSSKKLSVIQQTGDGNLFISGSVQAPEIHFITNKIVEDGVKIAGIEEHLLLQSEMFSLRAPGAVLKHGDIQVSDLDLKTDKSPIELSGSIKKVAHITVDGAGLILSQALTFETLKARGALLALAADTKVDCIDATAGILVVASSEDSPIKVEAKKDTSISFEIGQVVNAELCVTDGKLEIKVGKSLDIKPGYTRTSSSKTPTPSVMHGSESLTVILESKANFTNESCVLSSKYEVTHILGEGSKVYHHSAHKTDITHNEKKVNDLTFYEKSIKGDGGYHTETVKKTPISPQVKAPNVIFEGGGSGNVVLEGAKVDSSVLSMNVDTLEQKPAIARLEKSGQVVKGRVLWASLKEISLIETSPVPTRLEAKNQEIRTKKTLVEEMAATRDYNEKTKNRSLTPLSHVAIAVTIPLAIQYFGVASIVLNKMGAVGASSFMTCFTSGLISGIAGKTTTAGISWSIGDENYLDHIISQRVVTDLLISSLVAGVMGELGSAVLGDSYVSLGAQKLPHFISVADKTININVSNLMKHLGLLTANAVSDMVTMAASGNEITLEEFLFSLLRHEVSSLAAHGATHLGEKYGRGELSYWQHKKMHFSLGAGVFFIKTTPELYWRKDKHIKEKLLAGMLGAGLGASVAEVVAEYYFYKGISGITSNNDEKLFKQKMNEMHQRAALLGKLSSVLVGLGCLNEISLSASYEAGSRAIDHNYIQTTLKVIHILFVAYQLYPLIAEYIKVWKTGDREAIKTASINLAKDLAVIYATNKMLQYVTNAAAPILEKTSEKILVKFFQSSAGKNFLLFLNTKNNGMCPFAKKEIIDYLLKLSSKQSINLNDNKTTDPQPDSEFRKKKGLGDREKDLLKDKVLRGTNPGNVHMKGGSLRVDTEKLGGLNEAKNDYFKMTGEKICDTKAIQPYECADGKVITFRTEGKSGHPKISINDPVLKLIEKITYK